MDWACFRSVQCDWSADNVASMVSTSSGRVVEVEVYRVKRSYARIPVVSHITNNERLMSSAMVIMSGLSNSKRCVFFLFLDCGGEDEVDKDDSDDEETDANADTDAKD